MFGESRMELDPKDRSLLNHEYNLGWYSFWTALLFISIPTGLVYLILYASYAFYVHPVLFIMGIFF